ncbi:hypothetical protein OAE37_01090 [Pirellulaceae bacterium]|jgi:hypothetical protein|nr:hypothetical protein [Pirellulaceae bacterium]
MDARSCVLYFFFTPQSNSTVRDGSPAGLLKQSENSDQWVALVRSRGGYGTKIHVMTDVDGHLFAATATRWDKPTSSSIAFNRDHTHHKSDKKHSRVRSKQAYTRLDGHAV